MPIWLCQIVWQDLSGSKRLYRKVVTAETSPTDILLDSVDGDRSVMHFEPKLSDSE